MVAVPAGQGGIAGVGKQKLQCQRFDVAVAKYHVAALDIFSKPLKLTSK